MTKLFLGGVSPDTSNDTLRDVFSKFGRVADAVVMRDRGFGFVTFESQDSADAALAESRQVIDGRDVDVKPANGKGGGGRDGGDRRGGGGGGKGGGGGAGPRTDKVFVGGLPQDCSDDRIREYFGQYGSITDAVVMKDRETGRSRGFGFVQFDSQDPVEKVMEDYQNHKIEGKWVEVKRSVPRDQMAPPEPSSRGGGRDDRRGGGRDRDRRSDRDDRGGGGSSYPPPGAYGGGYPPAAYGYPPPAYGGYPGYPGYPAYPGYPPAPQGYPGYDPYAAQAYGAYGAPPPGAYGAAPPPAGKGGGGGGRPAPY